MRRSTPFWVLRKGNCERCEKQLGNNSGWRLAALHYPIGQAPVVCSECRDDWEKVYKEEISPVLYPDKNLWISIFERWLEAGKARVIFS